MSAPVDVLVTMDDALRFVANTFGAESAEATRVAEARAAVAELIAKADALLSATGKACSSWPLNEPKRTAWQALNGSLRVAVAADPYNGTTGDWVRAALARMGREA